MVAARPAGADPVGGRTAAAQRRRAAGGRARRAAPGRGLGHRLGPGRSTRGARRGRLAGAGAHPGRRPRGGDGGAHRGRRGHREHGAGRRRAARLGDPARAAGPLRDQHVHPARRGGRHRADLPGRLAGPAAHRDPGRGGAGRGGRAAGLRLPGDPGRLRGARHGAHGRAGRRARAGGRRRRAHRPGHPAGAGRRDGRLLTTARSATGTALVLVDLDHFTSVNDVHGHPVGDAVLQHVGAVLTAAVRSTDAVVSRLGGDELAVLLPGCPVEVAAGRAADLVDAVRSTPLLLADGTPLRLTVSVGVAHAPDHAADVRALYAVADAALYSAKRAGRDGFAVAGAPAHLG
ncbi:GGDEF domain-containing protein [Klenkia terrae]|uniref:GGDEF domain-containing protein n=1 Tax=Klenkia terrae TaxID=1052259 RepID=UPI0036208625